ncbi:hypothetical protein FGO68_gene9596 [Halteria grandinella]|uniref:Uncharacterized protein n=1 Tax=Halteria grandinella TaxID=5974 RepID=A0A8J8N9F6_HALGN|nr:hypothetical protein FGO68_gene9596 [Halteria grandinella]
MRLKCNLQIKLYHSEKVQKLQSRECRQQHAIIIYQKFLTHSSIKLFNPASRACIDPMFHPHYLDSLKDLIAKGLAH